MDPVPADVRAVMRRLEGLDARDREDGTARERRLRAVRPEVGEFLMTLVLATGARMVVELGTSGGYSTLWLAVGLSRTGGRVTTFEIDPAKVELASRSFADAGVDGTVDLRHQDAAEGLRALEPGSADLVFLDAEKEDYERFLTLSVTALRQGGLLVADNLTSHREDLQGFRDAALSHPELAGLVVPIGRGELVAVRA
ncbi:MAG TPA: O-methyltransferase [Actinomycetota bacterium]